MILEVLKDIVEQKKRESVDNGVIVNFLKAYLQYPILEFIYNSSEYKNFVFTGGSCLRICFNAPRLSEDLDFDLQEDDWKKLDLKILGEKLVAVFRDKYLLPVELRTQSNYRIYLKFPILKELGLTGRMESDFLFVKIEPNKMAFTDKAIEMTSIFKFGYNFVVNNYKKEFLMAGKIGAILNRVWFKGDKNEIDIKGRDFFDLYWYLQNGVEPDWPTLKQAAGIINKKELKEKILAIIDSKVTAQKLAFDLKKFFPDQIFVEEFCKNYKELISKLL